MKQIETNPTAKIAVKKNVLKQYRVNNEDVVYLAKDAEFEIELFNPLQETILAKIDFNNAISSSKGLILRPGERIFLERYLNTNNKFLFDVYSIDGSTAAKIATSKNGVINVRFYRERPAIKYNDLRVRGGSFSNPVLGGYCSSGSPYAGDCVITTSSSGNMGYVTSITANSSFTANATADIVTCNFVDTGIVAKGGTSDQEFVEVNQDFEFYPFYTVNVKLLPDTQRVFTTEDIKHRKYCSECGSKVKTNDKFCSNCGERL